MLRGAVVAHDLAAEGDVEGAAVGRQPLAGAAVDRPRHIREREQAGGEEEREEREEARPLGHRGEWYGRRQKAESRSPGGQRAIAARTSAFCFLPSAFSIS